MEGSRLGPYQLVAELGTGGMGKVYRAEVVGAASGLKVGGTVALKVIHAHLLETPGFFKRFLREADIGRAIEHENVVRTYDCDALLHEGRQQNFLVMEYVEGQTLRGLLHELDRVPEELCRHIGREVAKGLAAIHEAGVLHRDLKPENVLITEEHAVKIMDLGVARLQDEAIRLSQTGAFVGSLEYAAPEQFQEGGQDADGRSDLHALGVLLYELATGRHPFRGDDARTVLRRILDEEPRKAGEVNPQLTPFFEEVVQTLLAKDRRQRFAAASDVARILDEGEASSWWQGRAKALRAETKQPLRRIRIPRDTALYGRDQDLARLRDLYEEAKAGEGRVLLIEGEAGIGKTRLVDEFIGRLRQEGEDVNFLFGSYPPGGAATAAGAFSTAYREHFGAAGLEESLASYLQATPVLIPAFAALLRGESTPTGVERLTKDSLQTVFVHATRSLAAERTTIVLVDDLHFAPEEGRALFSSMAMSVPGHPILLLGTMRPGGAKTWHANVTRLDQTSHMPLSRLGAKDLAFLLRDAFHSERLADELGTKIAIKSDGNPFFTFEIIRGLREGQFIARQADGTWASTQLIQDIQVPSSVMDLVQARIADLDEEDGTLLDVSACCGFEFDPLLVARVLDVGDIPTLQRLARIEKKHRLVRSAGHSFVFDHHQVQEALYGGLPLPLQERYHAAIADALEEQADAATRDPGELDGALCVDLTEHLLAGARGEQALRYLDAALTHLERGFLNHQAIELADRALAIPDLLQGERRLQVLLRKNDRLELLGRREEQGDLLEDAMSLASTSADVALRANVERELGIMEMWTGHLDEALGHQKKALALLHDDASRRARASVAGDLGNIYCALSRYAEAREAQEQHLALAREFGDQQAEAAASINLGIVLKHLGRLTEAREHFENGLRLAVASGNRRWEANAHGNLANLLHAEGRHEGAREATERALTLFCLIGDRRGEVGCEENLGLNLLAGGHSAEARTCFEGCLALARELEDQEAEGRATGNLGSALLDLGRLSEALECHELSHALMKTIGARVRVAHAALSVASVWLSLGRWDEARQRIEEALTLSREIGVRAQEGSALHHLAKLTAEQGDVVEATRLAQTALHMLRETGSGATIAEGLTLLGQLQHRAGDIESARQALEEAAALSGPDQPVPHALALAALACLPGGNVGAVLAALAAAKTPGTNAHALELRYLLWKATRDRGHLEEAKRLLDRLVEHAPADCRESMRKNVRLHREVMEAWASLGPEQVRGEPGESATGTGEIGRPE